MDTKEIADKLKKYCESEEYLKAQKEMYAEDVISIDPEESPGFDKETKGLKNVNAKMEKFLSMIEESYGTKISEPIIAGNSFAFTLDMDVKMKGRDRMTMSEICIYTVKEGKVIKEEFAW